MQHMVIFLKHRSGLYALCTYFCVSLYLRAFCPRGVARLPRLMITYDASGRLGAKQQKIVSRCLTKMGVFLGENDGDEGHSLTPKVPSSISFNNHKLRACPRNKQGENYVEYQRPQQLSVHNQLGR